MSKWEQNAVFEYSEYICLVKRINGIVAQKTLVTELVRCKECRWATETRMKSIEGAVIYLKTCPSRTEVIDDDDFCSYGERKESE